MTYHHGWLFIQELNGNVKELFNHARTAAYLQQSTVLGCGTVYGVLDDGGCESYPWVPPLTDGGPSGGETEASNGWWESVYVDPATDDAPWYNPSYPESAQALGFWITQWTGLDSGHVSRTVQEVGGYRGGGQLSAAAANAREMGIDLILLGESEQALEYLFRWLEATLASVCRTCASDTILIRRTCPAIGGDNNNAANDVAEIREVGLLTGLTWGPPPTKRGGCYLRRANFTLGAADPCMYGPCTSVARAGQADISNVVTKASVDRSPCRPTCSEIGQGRESFTYTIDSPSAVAPVITLKGLEVDGARSTYPVRIRTYFNPNSLDADEICGAELVGELYVTALVPFSELRYDVARRRVLYRASSTSDWVDGFSHVEANDAGVPRFFSQGCGEYMTVIEPSDLCEATQTDAAYGASSINVVVTDGMTSRLWVKTVGATLRGYTPPGGNGAAVRFNGAVDTVWSDSIPPFANYQLFALEERDGSVVFFGSFATVDGVSKPGMARVWPSGSLDGDFNSGGTEGFTQDGPYTGEVLPDGRLLVAGLFSAMRGTTVNDIAILNVDGTVDTSFNSGADPGVNAAIRKVLVQDDGDILIGGGFTEVRGTTAWGFARLDGTTGALDGAHHLGTDGPDGIVRAMAFQSDGKVVIGGEFITIDGTTVNRIARMNTDGSLDTTFNTGGTVGVNNTVYGLVVQPDDKVIIAGDFTTARGTTVNYYCRLNADGTLDSTYNVGGTGAEDRAHGGLVLLPDGERVAIAGAFDDIRGDTRGDSFAILNNVGELDENSTMLTHFTAYDGPPTVEVSTRDRMGCV